MNVIYSGTRNLYPAMRGAILSLLEHNPDAKVWVLAEDDELPWGKDLGIRVINVSQQTVFPQTGPNMRSQFTYMAMMRAVTADLLPEEDRVIQLDVDTIVCDDLTPMWEAELDGKWLAWCEERWGSWKPYGPKYYNFGVAVMNLDQMRKDKAPELLSTLLNINAYQFVDQDVMNLCAVPARSVDLPVRYNESFCCGYTDSPAIIHYAGYPEWYTVDYCPRWWARERWKKIADEVFGPETGVVG